MSALHKGGHVNLDNVLSPDILENENGNEDVVQTGPSSPRPSSDNTSPRSCWLALGSIDRIVAKGYLYNEDASFILHGVPLGEGNARVSVFSINKIEYEPERIPFPTIGASTLQEAVCGFVAWPRELVVLDIIKKPVKAPHKSNGFDIIIKQFAKLVERATKDKPSAAIYVKVDRDVFRSNNENYVPSSTLSIFRDELLDLVKFKEIGASLMKVFMCALHKKAKETGNDRLYRFAEPAGFAGHLEYDNSEALCDNMETAEQGQLFFYPFNIGVCKNLDYILRFESNPKIASFEKVLCPRQPGYVECGYYVIKYMKDIMDAHGTHPRELFGNEEEYSKESMDEVRVELMNYIRDHM